MRRAQKYPNTSTFYFFNANPHNRIAADCVARAISTALEQSWEQTIRELTEIGIKYGYVFNEKKCYEKYLTQKGWKKMKQPRKSDGTKFTGKEFCRNLTRYDSDIDTGNTDMHHIIAHIGGHHIVAIVDGKVRDIWDSTDGCIGNYWVKA